MSFQFRIENHCCSFRVTLVSLHTRLHLCCACIRSSMHDLEYKKPRTMEPYCFETIAMPGYLLCALCKLFTPQTLSFSAQGPDCLVCMGNMFGCAGNAFPTQRFLACFLSAQNSLIDHFLHRIFNQFAALPAQFSKKACKFCFCPEWSGFNTILAPFLFVWMVDEEWTRIMRETVEARGTWSKAEMEI